MKKHNSVLRVDLGSISSNLRVLRSHLKPGVNLMPVIKEDAYGHGAIELARHVQSEVDWFAVNDIYEGIELREHGIELPILVFSVPEKEFSHLYSRYNLTASVSARSHFELLNEGTEYHLNFDTGMGRLGLRPAQRVAVLKAQANHPEIHCTGIYSHFSTADEQESTKMQQQYNRFKELRQHFSDALITHMANTAGAVQLPGAQFDIVRVGIGMYGYAPGAVNIEGIVPVMSWETHLVQVNEIQQGETVSYGATWAAPRDGYVAAIPVGYADGIPRGLSNNFYVRISGVEYPVVGTVTMNYCMIFLGDNQPEEGAKVQLWYPGQTAADWGQKMGTIPYEMLTGVSSKIPRKYEVNT